MCLLVHQPAVLLDVFVCLDMSWVLLERVFHLHNAVNNYFSPIVNVIVRIFIPFWFFQHFQHAEQMKYIQCVETMGADLLAVILTELDAFLFVLPVLVYVHRITSETVWTCASYLLLVVRIYLILSQWKFSPLIFTSKTTFAAIPACTRANEVLSTCGDDCCQRTCQKLDVSGCVPVCTGRACVCAFGYVRDSAGNCILPSMCRKYFFLIKLLYSCNEYCYKKRTKNFSILSIFLFHPMYFTFFRFHSYLLCLVLSFF